METMAPTQANRGPRSQEQPGGRPNSSTNVGDGERWLSLLGGTALALTGLSRGSLGGLCQALLGSGLVCRGATGHCQVYDALDVNTAEPHCQRARIPAGHGVKVEAAVTV